MKLVKERQKRQQKRHVEEDQEDGDIQSKSRKTESDLTLNLPEGFSTTKMAFIPVFFKN